MASIMLDALRSLIMGAAGDALFPKRETPAPVEDRSVQMPSAQPQGASIQAASPRPVNRNPMVPMLSGTTTQPYRPTGDSSAMFGSTEPDMQPSNPQMQGINQDMAGFAQQQPKKIDVVNQQLNQQVQEELKQLKPEAAELASQQEIMDSAYAYTLAKNSPTYAQVQEDPELGSDFQNTLKKAFGNEEMWLTLAMGFNGMRLRPDATLGAALADRLKTIRASKTAIKNAPIIAQRLRDMGYPKWAAYVEQNPSQADKLMEQIMQKEFKPAASVKTSGVRIDPVTGQEYVVKTDPVSGEVTRVDIEGAKGLTPQAQADMDALEASYTLDLKTAQEYGQEIFNKARSLDAEIGKYDDINKALDEGANTGWIQNQLPTFTKATAQLETAARGLGIDVINSATFGALSEKELDLAMRTRIDITLPPDELRKQVKEVMAAQKKMRDELYKQAKTLLYGNVRYSEWASDFAEKALRKSAKEATQAQSTSTAPTATTTGLPPIKLKSIKPVGQ